MTLYSLGKKSEVAGSVKLNAEESKIVAEALRSGIFAFRQGWACLCWAQRHAVEITSQGHTFRFNFSDLSSEIDINKDGAFYRDVYATGIQVTLDSLLLEHGIPIIPPL